MPRYFFEISYDGTDYSGWQRQQNALTVQEVIETQLSKIVGESIPIMGCGRTDAGVHASQFYFHADIQDSNKDTEKVEYQLNQSTPHDIAVHRIIEVGDTAHARFDAVRRSYAYHLHVYKSPFKRRFSTFYPTARKLEFSVLEEVAQLLLQFDDFASFCKTHTDVKTTICRLSQSSWLLNPKEGTMTYKISADRFLRGMVRLIVGTSINVALGKLSITELESCIAQGIKPPHAHSAPPNGLFLTEVAYDYIGPS